MCIRMKYYVPLLSLLAACGGDASAEFGDVRRVPKDERPLDWEARERDRLGVPEMGGTKPMAPSPATRVRATTPPGWEEIASTRQFRDAVWRITGQPDADCYLSIGIGGGVASNLARWYGQQFGKAQVPAAESLPALDFIGRQGRLVEIEGTMDGKADWAALIAFANEGQQVTSLKFTGPKAVVAANRDQFLALARSIRLEDGGAGAAGPVVPPIAPGQRMPEGHPPTGAQQAPAAQQAPFTAETPAGWTALTDSRRYLHHSFGGDCEVYLSTLGGGLKPSLDIWRGEIGLGPMSDAEFQALPKTMFLGDDAVLLDLTGTFRSMTGKTIPEARLLLAARADGNVITFCKLVGPAADLADQVDAFRRFCGSIRRAP
jgi:hypothetical protein